MPGPMPKPTAVRRLEGNLSRRPINEQEPKPKLVQEQIPPPEDLPEAGKKVWVHLSEELMRIGLLSIIDLELLYRYIKYMLEYRDADSKINGVYYIPIFADAEKKVVKYLMQNPLISVRNKAADMMLKLEQNLGMTPAARARMIGFINGVGGGGNGEEKDPYAA